jgi:hypothetical protein
MEALSRKLDNLNVYDQVEFKQKFMQSKIYKMIDAEAEIIIWEKNHEIALYEFTPRHQFWFKIATMQSCYYIDLLYENNPSRIYDIGCGINWHKQFYPNIYGIAGGGDGGEYFGDERGRWGEGLESKLTNIEAMFAINALHFRSVHKIRTLIEEVISTLAINGRAYLSFNSRQIRRHTNKKITTIEVIKYLRYDLAKIESVRWLVVDMDSSYESPMNGNISLVFERI